MRREGKEGFSQESEFRILTGRDMNRALPMADAIDAVKEAFAQLSSGKAILPLRINLQVPPKDRTTLVMPAYLRDEPRMAVKIISLFQDNPAKGLPLIHAVVVLLDGETGQPLALLDGTSLTALRTGAASGVATDLLARREARMAAIFGAGLQARKQLEAVCTVRSIERAWVYDPARERARTFAGEMSGQLSICVETAPTPGEALLHADIICTATTSATPVFLDSDIRPGVHINAVGAYTPFAHEIPEETVVRSRVVVDHWEACMEEAGDILIPMRGGRISRDHIQAELGEILTGRRRGRLSEEDVTLFKSVGVAVQDVAAAGRALRNAEKMGLGQRAIL